MRLDSPLKIEGYLRGRVATDPLDPLASAYVVEIYSMVLKEIARRGCIDPLSLARAALLAEGYKADRHE